MAETPEGSPVRKSAAGTVAAGILSSRVVGFLRESVMAYFFGVGAHADVLRTALRMPNVLQNLLGEGTISAAFIPIYSRMVEAGREEDAGRFAGAIFGLLLATVAAFVLLGIVFAAPIVAVLAAGFVDDAAAVAAGQMEVDRFALSVQAVRIIFPMTGVLVLSAWALGVLNSHRRFFLPYFAPVLWNTAIIAALFAGAAYLFGGTSALTAPEQATTEAQTDLLFAAFFGALAGGLLQFLVQLPLVFRLMRHFRLSFSRRVAGVQEALRAFGPVVAGRGVAQISSYLDMFLASLLAAGAVSAIGFAQTLYLLPVSLFGMSVAASELPELSRLTRAQLDAFLERLRRSLSQILFLTVPTIVGYLVFGRLIAGVLFQRGNFDPSDTWLVYTILAAYTLGLLATTLSRLLQNAFWALDDTRTPARIAVVRVVVSTALAVPLMLLLDRFAVADVVGLPVAGTMNQPYFGAVGLALGAPAGAWVELWRLRVSLRRHASAFRLPWSAAARMIGYALAAAVPAGAAWWLLTGWPQLIVAPLVVGLYAAGYLLLARLSRAPEMAAWTGRWKR